MAELSPRDIEELFSLRDVLERFALHCAPGDGRPADPAGLLALDAA